MSFAVSHVLNTYPNTGVLFGVLFAVPRPSEVLTASKNPATSE